MYGKILIRCELEVLTGMHIGGSDSFSAIGAVDKTVARDPRTGMPIVPGSSLKGKLRSLLARSAARDIGKISKKPDGDGEEICRLFGSASPVRPSRLQFADCFVGNAAQMKAVGLTEVKTENAIDRVSGVANPRQIERVNSGTKFDVNITYNIIRPEEVQVDFALLAKGFRLLQLDYLGGHGSRGSGRVRFANFEVKPFEADVDAAALQEQLREVEAYALLAV